MSLKFCYIIDMKAVSPETWSDAGSRHYVDTTCRPACQDGACHQQECRRVPWRDVPAHARGSSPHSDRMNFARSRDTCRKIANRAAKGLGHRHGTGTTANILLGPFDHRRHPAAIRQRCRWIRSTPGIRSNEPSTSAMTRSGTVAPCEDVASHVEVTKRDITLLSSKPVKNSPSATAQATYRALQGGLPRQRYPHGPVKDQFPSIFNLDQGGVDGTFDDPGRFSDS